MTWVKLDDGFYDNPKVEAAGLAAAGLYAKSLAYCGRHLTDGYVPWTFVRAKGAAAKLVKVGLWTENGSGWVIDDYTEFNFTRDKVLEKRKTDAARKRKQEEEDNA
jgi:hypothetical protein